MLNRGVYEKEFALMLKDVDKNNKMKFSSCLNFMQEIGGLHANLLGFGLNEEIKTNRAWIVIAWNLEIFKRPSWNEKLKIKTWIGKMDRIYHYRDYEILDSENQIIAKGIAQWVMVDTINKKILRTDETSLEAFKVVEIAGYDNNIRKINSKINVENLSEIYNYVVEKRDVDKNNHMNNVVYLDLALEGLSDEFIDTISNIEIHYKTECKYNEEITFLKDEENNIYIMDKNKEKLHTVVTLK